MAEIARGSRYSLLAVEGFTITPSADQSGRRTTISYCIVDRDCNYTEVWRDYSGERGRNYGTRIGRRATAMGKLEEYEADEAQCRPR